MRLATKVAIITGGGSGIGKASAHLFAQEGAKVVVAQRTRTTGEETVAAINSSGGEAIFIATDVSVEAEVDSLVETTVNKFGKIDILFNNAGISIPPAPIETIEESQWDHIYAVNIKGMFLMVKYIVPEMKRAGGGVIINNSSLTGHRPVAKSAAYSSTKAAVIALTKSLALELAPDNIRVNCISPGNVETPMTKQLPEERIKARTKATPLGQRPVWPKEIAYAALYLASDESSMVTGININVDGGLSL